MRILLNATTIAKGGGLQVAVNLLGEVLKGEVEHEWCLALSRKLFAELKCFELDGMEGLHVFDKSPARSREYRRKLRLLESRFKPDCVFTIFGPAYVKFRAPHLLGFADGWVTHSAWSSFRTLSFPRGWLSVMMTTAYKAFWLRHADAWVVEAEVARQGLHRRFRLPVERIGVVPNSCGRLFFKRAGRRPFPAPGSKVRFLYLTAAYNHKRLAIIPHVAKELLRRRPDLDFEFVLTLPPDNVIFHGLMRTARRLNVHQRINNVGPVPVAEAPALYQTCDVSFLPTVLETFSAMYPEAMAMGLPIVSTDLDITREVCGDAALFFEPYRPASAAEKLLELLGDEALWNRLIDRGKEVLAGLPTPCEKYERYLELLSNLVAGRRLLERGCCTNRKSSNEAGGRAPRE